MEAGQADVIVAAYLDRLTRSMRVRDEVIERVELAGGAVLAVDMGFQSNSTSTQWLMGTLGSAFGEYQRRQAAERSAVAQQRAIERGIAPWPQVPPGYMRPIAGRRQDGRVLRGKLEPDPKTAPAIVEAFRLRAEGTPLREIRAYLRQHGIKRSFHGVGHLLNSRVYLGEIHFGHHVPNLEAHQPIIERELWEAVQKIVIPRGRKPQSERILARLGILRCGTCNARMCVGLQTQNGRKYPFYRCPPTGDCKQRMAISAHMAEGAVVDAVKREVADVEGHASTETNAREAAVRAGHAQDTLDAALRSFAGFEDETAARERLTELRTARDEARDEAHRLGGLSAGLTIDLANDWDRLGLEAQRRLVELVIERAVVMPGRGPDRIRVELFSENPSRL